MSGLRNKIANEKLLLQDNQSMESREKKSETFCYYPFTQLVFQPGGEVSPCCYLQDVVLGKMPQDTIQQIWNGEKLRQLRKEFIEGNPKRCTQNIKHIQCHKESHREFNQQLVLSETLTTGPSRFDLRLNGTCNLQCVMCQVWKSPKGTYENSSFWSEAKRGLFSSLKEIDVLGGEPFVQKDTFRLIQQVSQGNPHCTWAFVTNGQYKFTNTIIKALDSIAIRWILLSLDSIRPETYRTIRVGGELEKALETLRQLILYRQIRKNSKRGFSLCVAMCVQKSNWKEVDEFLEFSLANKLTPLLQFLYEPHKLSLRDMPPDEIKEAIEYLHKMYSKYQLDIILRISTPLKELVQGC